MRADRSFSSMQALRALTRISSRQTLHHFPATAIGYLKIKGDSINSSYDYLVREIRALNSNEGSALEIPSINTLKRRVGELPKMLVDRHRYGTAYAKNKWRYSIHGDQSTRVMERVEIDHTLLDVWVIDPRSGIPLGRPWITVLIDRYSKYVVGIHVSFYGPSTSSVASALKMSIEPKDVICEAVGSLSNFWTAYGVAEVYVMDNGKEMHSDRFRRIGWELQSDFIYNPVRHPWLKSSIERTMREICRILPAAGKVYAPVKNAQVPDPKKTASIMFDDLCEGLIKWVVDVYPSRVIFSDPGADFARRIWPRLRLAHVTAQCHTRPDGA